MAMEGNTVKRGVQRRYTGNVVLAGALAANGVHTLWTPAQNPNGIILRKLMFMSASGGGNWCAVLAKASAPTNLADGILIALPNAIGILTGSQTLVHDSNPDLDIAPGLGLYFITAVAETVGLRGALYEAF